MGKLFSMICSICVDKEEAEKEDKKDETYTPDHSVPRQTQSHNTVNTFQPETQNSKPAASILSTQGSVKSMSPSDRAKVQGVFDSHFILKLLSSENKHYLIGRMEMFFAFKYEIICKQGEPGDYFFILTSGSAEVRVHNIKKNILKEGASFGELALIARSPRTATVRALENCRLWGISQKVFRKTIKEVSLRHYDENKAIIENVSIFSPLNETQKDRLLNVLTVQDWEANMTVFNQGDHRYQLFIVKSGKLVCFVNGEKLKEITPCEYFGELALLGDSTSGATVITSEPTVLLALSRDEVKAALGNSLEKAIHENTLKIAILRNKALSFLTSEQIDSMVKAFEIKAFSEGEIVIHSKQDKSVFVHFVVNGYLKCGKKKICKYGSLGVSSVLSTSPKIYKNNYRAGKHCEVAICAIEDIKKYLDILQLKSVNRVVPILKTIKVFKLLTEERLEKIAELLEVRRFPDQSVIAKENTPADYFFILKKGRLNVFKDNEIIGAIDQHNYFGEISILMNENKNATVVANGPVECWVLSQENFLSVIDDTIRAQMLKRVYLLDNSITLDDLSPIKSLGAGAFANVVLASNKNNSVSYAVKCISIRLVKRFKVLSYVNSECQILQQIDHPLILKFVKLIDDKNCIYLITEFIEGHDLLKLLNMKRKVSESAAKFYASCLVLVFNYLHKRKILYRDLKPENVMIDEDGYLKLIDFGAAKVVSGRTYTILGTPHYMAPEVILGNGYSTTADIWSLGVVLYELLFGCLPFGDNSSDAQTVYRAILTNDVQFPSANTVSDCAKGFIELLLNKKQASRLQNLKDHPWFHLFDWKGLAMRSTKAPYIPKLEDCNDKDTCVLLFSDFLKKENLKGLSLTYSSRFKGT